MNHLAKSFFSKNWLIIAVILPVIFSFFTTFFIDFEWDNPFYKKTFINSSFAYVGACIVVWIVLNHSHIFSKGQWLRNTIVVVGSCVVLLWTYKHKITFRFDILLLILTGVYVLIYRKWERPTFVILSFLAFVIFKSISILWSPELAYSLAMIQEEQFVFQLLVVAISFGFRVKQKEQDSFIALCFKIFLGLLSCNILFYILYTDFLHKPFFSFFTLDKGYMSFYEVLSWSYFQHPSFISWIFLLIGGLGVFVWKKNKALITTLELILYAIFLLFFVFIVQARIAILGYFIALGFFLWIYVSRYLSKYVKYSIITGGSLLAVVVVYLLTTQTSYFSDPIRNNTLEIVSNHISKANIFWGSGLSMQRFIMKDTGIFHVHNDFLSILIDLGIIGLFLFLMWILSIIKTGDYRKQYALLICLLIMNTDVLFCFYLGTYIVVALLFFIFFAKESKGSITT